MPVIVDQINDMIKAGVPVDQINKFKENRDLSTENYGVFINFSDKHIILSIRGSDFTQSLKDIYYEKNNYFIFLVMKQLMDGLVSEIKTVQGITQMLITRASIMNNDTIRIDTLVSAALDLSPDLDRIARAENFVEDGKIDARRD